LTPSVESRPLGTPEAALEAAFAEIPLALVCLWLAHHGERAIAGVLEAAGRAPQLPPGGETG